MTDDYTIDDDFMLSDITSIDVADQLWEQVMQDKIRIEAQLEYANAFFITKGYHEDPMWAARARAALGFKKKSLSLIQMAKGRLAREHKQSVATERDKKLINLLRKEIGDERFLQIAREIE